MTIALKQKKDTEKEVRETFFKVYKLANLVWGVFFASLFVYISVITFYEFTGQFSDKSLAMESGKFSVIRNVLAVIGILIIIGSFFIKGLFLNRTLLSRVTKQVLKEAQKPNQPPVLFKQLIQDQKYRSKAIIKMFPNWLFAHIVVWCFLEALSIFGMILTFLSHNQYWFLPFVSMNILLMMIHRPQKNFNFRFRWQDVRID